MKSTPQRHALTLTLTTMGHHPGQLAQLHRTYRSHTWRDTSPPCNTHAHLRRPESGGNTRTAVGSVQHLALGGPKI